MYSKVFRLTSGERRKIEFTNESFELRFIYDFALAPFPFSIPAVTPFAVERRRPRVAAPFNTRRRLSHPSRPIWFSPLHSHLTRAELCSHATLAVSHGRRRPRPPRRPAPSPSLSPNRVPQHDHRLPVTLPNPSAPLNRRRQAVAAAQSPAGRPLPVELQPPAFFCPNGAREQDPRIPVKLIGPSPPPLARRSAAADEPHRRRPLVLVEVPPRTTSSRAKATSRCATTSSCPSPTYPTPPEPLLAGKSCVLPPLFLPRPRTCAEKKQKPRGLDAKVRFLFLLFSKTAKF